MFSLDSPIIGWYMTAEYGQNYVLMAGAENTRRWGKYHCTAGLQFYKFGVKCFTTY